LEFEQKWWKKYPLSCKSWIDNWLNLSAFYAYDSTIRKIIYTTNPIEGVHRQLRKITKSKGAFNSGHALFKLVCLVVKDVSRKWTMPIHNWGMAFSQLYIKFGDLILNEGINN
jgi:putative transposase